MAKPKGGKIKNWKKSPKKKDFWYYTGGQSAQMSIQKTGRGYNIYVFGEDIRYQRVNDQPIPTLRQARQEAADWRRQHTQL